MNGKPATNGASRVPPGPRAGGGEAAEADHVHNPYTATVSALRANYPDISPHEQAWAMAPLYTHWVPEPETGVARVGAMREARLGEPDMSDDAWWECVDGVTDRLSEAERQDPDAIIAAVHRRIDIETEILGLAPRPAERVSHGLTAPMIQEATAQERIASYGHPHQLEVAVRLNTSRSNLQRALKDLGMGPWPPAPLRD